MGVRKRMRNGKESRDYWYFFTVDGKRYRGNTGETDEDAAKAVEARVRKDIYSPHIARESLRKIELAHGQKVLPLADVKAAFENKKPQAADHQSVDRYTKIWVDFHKFMTARYPEVGFVHEIDGDHAEEYQVLIQKQSRFDMTIESPIGKGKKGTYKYERKATRNRIRTSQAKIGYLRHVLNIVSGKAGIQKRDSVFHNTDSIKVKKAEQDHYEPYTEDEVALLKSNPNSFCTPIFIIGNNTGLRLADICTLEWNEVDLDACLIRRKARKNSMECTPPINRPLRQFLLAQREITGHGKYVLREHAKTYLNDSSNSDISRAWGDWVDSFTEPLIDENGKNVIDATGDQVMTPVIKRKEDKGDGTQMRSVKCIHSLRHTYCFRMAFIQRIPLPVIAKLVGHSDEEMTAMYANHATEEQVKKYALELAETG